MRTIGRRAWFFLGVAFVSLLLLVPCPPEFRWVAWFCAGLAAFWGVLQAVESLASSGPPSHPR